MSPTFTNSFNNETDLFAPGGTARVGAAASGTRPVLDEPDLPSIDLSTVQFLQGSFHV